MTKSQHSDDYKAFCALLIEARKKAGLSQQQVADQLGKPQSFIAKYEKGERRLDVIEFIEIARVLGMSPVGVVRKLQRDESVSLIKK